MTKSSTSRCVVRLSLCLLAIAYAGTMAQAQIVREVKDFPSEDFWGTAIDDAGTAVYAVTTSNQYGTNPGYRKEILRWDPTTGAGTQVTTFEEGVETVSLTDDGQWLAFVSNGDLTGSNHDESAELFVMRPNGTGLAQLTNDTSLAGDGVTTAVISGSGNRVVFSADTDPLGTNPGRTPHYFVVDFDGTNLVQLGEAHPGPYRSLAAEISDDGNRIAFLLIAPTVKIFSVPADGSTSAAMVASGVSNLGSIALAGNGETIIFGDLDQISKVNWDGTGSISPVATGIGARVTDDGQTVIYRDGATGGIWKIGADGTGATQLASEPAPRSFAPSVLSGDGSRIVVREYGPTNSSTRDLVAMDGSGGSVHQLTAPSLGVGFIETPVILATAGRIYFRSNRNLLASNPDGSWEIFTMSPNGSGLAQVTQLTRGVNSYAVADSGLVVFESSDNPAGHNPCLGRQIFKINTDGTGLTQLTLDCAGSIHLDPQVLFNGQYVVFQGLDRVGSNTDGSPELFRVAANGTGLTPITVDNDSSSKAPRLSVSAPLGTAWIVYQTGSNADGLNPSGHLQIFRITLFASGLQRLTADPTYDSVDPDVSGDGNRIVWWSQADFAGSNPGHMGQIFLWDATTGTKRQLTSATTEYVSGPPRISRDGAWVYFWQNGLARVSVATGVIQRVTGFDHATSSSDHVAVDSAANHAVFVGQDIIDRSPGATSVFLVDQTVKPKIVVGRTAPTLVTWDPDPESTRYDVIRGDIASLGIASGTVNLGPVTCIEDDSPDNHTRGFEDALQPAPGQVLFYLYRGTTGLGELTGSWGQGTGGLERVPGSGSCNP